MCPFPAHPPVSGGSTRSVGVGSQGSQLVAAWVLVFLEMSRTESLSFSVTYSMAESPRTRVPYSRGDKFLLVSLGTIAALVVGISLWLHILDTDPVIAIPAPTMPAHNARDYFIEAANGVVDEGKISFVNWQPEKLPKKSPASPLRLRHFGPSGNMYIYSPEQKAALVTENSVALQALQQGFRYSYQELPMRSFKTETPHYAQFRSLSRLLELQSQVKAAKGDWNGSMNAALDAIQMGEEIPHGGTFMGMVIGVFCQTQGRCHAWTAIGHLSSTETKASIKRLQHISTRHVRSADIFGEEKRAFQGATLELMRKKDWAGELLSAVEDDGWGHRDGLQRVLATALIRTTGKRKIMTNFTNYMNRCVADASLPYAAHLAETPHPTDLYNGLISTYYAKARTLEVGAETQNALLLTALALQAYKLEQGRYPMTLAALVPVYLKELPSDPFALSSALSYKLQGAKFLLYSVGPDGNNDGGQPIFDVKKEKPSAGVLFDQRYRVKAESKGDIVAGVNVN